MILRKPYAFLIKNFKLFHMILTACMFYLIYRTEMMISFLNEYIGSNDIVRGREIVSGLYNIWVFLLPIFIILFSAIILTVLAVKKKPKLFYVLCIVSHVAILVVYVYGHGVFSDMEQMILDLRTIRAIRDLFIYCILFQGIFSIRTLIRAIGFDFKKFDFGSDGLEITETDNEEIELDFDFDLSDKKRKGKRILREIKYKLKENKFIVRIALGLLVAAGLFYGYNQFNIYNRLNPEGTNFTMNGFTMGVHRSYLVNADAHGRELVSDRYLLIVDLNVRCNNKTATAMNTGTLELDIAGTKYKHVSNYASALSDLGIVYSNQPIGNEFTRYLLVYEIPLNALNSKMRLGFVNLHTDQTARVRVNYQNKIKQKVISNHYYVGDTIDFKESTLGNTTLKINSYEIKNRFMVEYRYCSGRLQTCIPSVEYVSPTLFNSRRSKSLLKLELDLKFDENFISKDIKDIYGMMKSFGYIEYTFEGEEREQRVYLGDAKSTKVKQDGIFYIEVFEEIRVAEKITLVFKIRNVTYRYNLK